MLELICGEAGTGKTALLYSKIREDAKNGKRVFLFVPDQFSFEAEKIICKTIPSPDCGNVSVTMFSRASQRLLHLYGETKEYADDAAKTLLMTRALNTLAAQGRLLYYRGQFRKAGFAGFALDLISQLRGAGLTPPALRSRIADSGERISGTLLDKLNDLCEIFTVYDELLSLSFDDRLDDVRRAAELMALSREAEGSRCYFDGFDDFSGSQLCFIKALLQKAENVCFTVTVDTPDTEKQHFLAGAALISRLKQLSGGEASIIKTKHRYREGCKAELVKARDPWQECDWICARIRSLLDEGFRCREIAVLIPEPVYAEILGSAMRKYGIPYFADIPEPLLHKPPVRFAIDTLRALSFETDDLLRYIKSGFVRHSDGQTISDLRADELERICRRYDVRKRDWLRPFPEKLDGSGSAEELRKSVIEPLKRLKKKLEDADGAEMTEALCSFLIDEMELDRTVYSLCIQGRDDGGRLIVDKKKMDGWSSLWDDVITVFESAHEALKGYRLPVSEYIDILTGIFTSTQVAKPPQVLDAVTVGDVERSRFDRVRAVFICGFSQGVFPRPSKKSAAFSGSETQLLSECGIAIGADRLTRSSSELFLLYRCVNLPEERLYVTYPALSDTFSERLPSPYIENLKKRFGIQAEGADEYGAAFYCRTEQSARRYLAGIWSDPERSGEREAILSALSQPSLFAGSEFPERHLISRERAELLLSPEAYSPTAINSMNNCKFGYFCAYGLGLREEEERSVSAALSGSVVHYCMERLFREFTPERFAELSERELLDFSRESVRKYENEVFFGSFGAAERFTYQLSRLSELAAKTAVRLQRCAKFSSFYPVGRERTVRFRFGDITIRGICDRLDISESGGKTYLRVVDYKRGKKELPLDSVYGGENLQMLLYLFGLCEEYGAEPSSVLYQPIGQDSFADSDGEDRESAAADRLRGSERAHAAGGLVLEQSPERAELDALNDYYAEAYGKTRGGYCAPTVISAKSYESLKSYCKAYVNALALQTKSGMASACPKSEDSCKYCEFGLFCGKQDNVNRRKI